MENYLQIKNSNIFGVFPDYNLETSNNVAKNLENKTTTNLIEQSLNCDSFEESNEKPKTSRKKKILFGSTIASAIFTTGIISLFLMKGVHGSQVSKFSKFLERISQKMHIQGHKPKDLTTKTIYYTQKGIKKTSNTLQATSNFTAIKDWICDKVLRMNKATRKFADGSTALFKKVVDKTLGKQYDHVEVKVKDLTSLLKHYNIDSLNNLSAKDKLQKITIKGQTKTLGEWIQLLSQHNNRLESVFDNNFSLGARRLRDKKRMSLLADLPQKIQERFFKNKNSLLNPENYRTYATQDLTNEARIELQNDILSAKRQISNGIATIHETIKSAISKFSKNIKPEDQTTKEAVKQLKQQFENFKSCSGENEAKARQKISKEISTIINNLINATKTNGLYNVQEQEEMIKYLSSVQETIASSGAGSKGALEEIMTILNGLNAAKVKSTGQKIISDQQHKEFTKLSSLISKNLEKATEKEANEYFLKQAEMKVGSAATDVLSVLFPLGVGAYSIASSDGKEEKISTTLTVCVPLVGTFATLVYGTTKMFSGVKNLGLAMASGVVLKMAGNGLNKLYKKYKKSGSVTDVMMDEYNKFITGEDKTETKNKK